MIEYFKSVHDGQWYWRYRAKNGQVSITGHEGFASKWNAKRAARRAGLVLAVARSKEV